MTAAPRPLGLVRDMSMDEYQAVDAMSATGLRHFSRSAWHYRHKVETEPTRPMLRGTLAHCAVLEPDAMASRYVVVPDDAPRRPSKVQWTAKNPSPDSITSMQWWTAFNASCEGREIVSAPDYLITQAQLLALQADPEISKTLASGFGECSIFWVDKASGVYCKARPDWIHPLDSRRVVMVDLKSMADESPDAFSRTAPRMGFHRQRAHYINGVQQATGFEVADFFFAAVTSAAPVLAVPYRLVDEVVLMGEEECESLLLDYADCRRQDHWPAYPPAARMIDFPKWAKPNREVEVSFDE